MAQNKSMPAAFGVLRTGILALGKEESRLKSNKLTIFSQSYFFLLARTLVSKGVSPKKSSASYLARSEAVCFFFFF
jgi:hypothetical protein